MYPLCIVEIHIVLNTETQLRQTDIIFDFDVFVFQRPPETLHFGIIAAASAPVHADLNSIFLQFSDELITGLLAALVGIKYFRLSKAFYRHSQRFHTVKRIHRIDHIICHQFTAEPVYYADYKCPVPINCRISNICTPYLIEMIYFQAFQEVRKLLVFRMGGRKYSNADSQIYRPQSQRFFANGELRLWLMLNPRRFNSAVKRETCVEWGVVKNIHDFVLGSFI